MFFGPRKLPQLARSMGKGLTEFRKASDDFKRTWEREVALETARVDDGSLFEAEQQSVSEPPQTSGEPATKTEGPELVAADPELAVPRESAAEVTPGAVPEVPEISAEPIQTEPVRKQD